MKTLTNSTRSWIHNEPLWSNGSKEKSFNEIKEKSFPDGSHYWYLNGRLHREDGPALITSSGNKFWYLHGKRYEPVEWMLKLHDSGLA